MVCEFVSFVVPTLGEFHEAVDTVGALFELGHDANHRGDVGGVLSGHVTGDTLDEVFSDILHHEVGFFLHLFQVGNFTREVLFRTVESFDIALVHCGAMGGHLAYGVLCLGDIEFSETAFQSLIRNAVEASYGPELGKGAEQQDTTAALPSVLAQVTAHAWRWYNNATCGKMNAVCNIQLSTVKAPPISYTDK